MSEAAPLVSVILPCWNSAASIERSIASALTEDDFPLECVVVDDASTDDTVAVVEAIARRDPRIVLVRAPQNGGVSAARNLALDVVRGEWITYLDADDRFLPGGLGAMVRAGRSTDALAVVGQRILSDGERTWVPKPYDTPDIKEPGRKSLARHPGLMNTASVTGKVFHRSCTDGLRFEGRVLGDQPWALRALLRAGDRIEVIGATVYEWTRPSPTNQFVSITAMKRGSAALAADAVDVAVGALRTVSGEARRVLADPEDRDTIARRYFERLVRDDISGPVARAIKSGDPGTPRLFRALAAFLAAAPPDIVTESTIVTSKILRPPLAAWQQLPPPSRAAYWAIVRAMPGSNRQVADRVAVSAWSRRAIRMARVLPDGLGDAVANLAMRVGHRRAARRRIRDDKTSG